MLAQRNVDESAQRSRAARLAYDMVERMRSNNAPAALEAYVESAAPWAGRGAVAGRITSPPCAANEPCPAPSVARANLLEWERGLDGADERQDDQWVGGLRLPTACINGPGDTGIYTVAIAWRGSIALPPAVQPACGMGATAGGEPVYGERDQFRRILVLPAYIVARP